MTKTKNYLNTNDFPISMSSNSETKAYREFKLNE